MKRGQALSAEANGSQVPSNTACCLRTCMVVGQLVLHDPVPTARVIPIPCVEAIHHLALPVVLATLLS